MFLQRTEQFHNFLVKRCAYFAQQICVPTALSGPALDREHRFDLIRLAAVDGRLPAFVVKRVDDHLESSIAIQIKDCSEVVYIRRNRVIRFRLDLTRYKFCLNIPVDYAPQDEYKITSTLPSVNWGLRERRC